MGRRKYCNWYWARGTIKMVFLAAALLGVLAKPHPLLSQTITGDILGTVTDSSGAVVPGAEVSLQAVNKGMTLTTKSDDSGNYVFAKLLPGHYSIKVSKEGFRATVISDIVLLVAQRPRVDVVLQVGAVSQTVEVNAGGVQLLDTQTSAMGQVIQADPIVGLPLNGRNYMQLAVLSAGVSIPSYNASGAPSQNFTGTKVGQVSVSVAGLRESNVSYQLDGVENKESEIWNHRNPGFH